MFWNKKDGKDGLPDLPPLKSPMNSAFAFSQQKKDAFVDDVDSDEPEESHSLPSFPDSPMQKSFSQTAIKDAITQPMLEDHELPEEEPQARPMVNAMKIKTMEMDSSPMPSVPSQPKQERSFTLEEPPQSAAYVPPRKPLAKANEIFVKVEHFNSAYKSITSIRKKVDDIDMSLKRIREIKMREEQELASWEKEIASLKGRLQEVSDTIFE